MRTALLIAIMALTACGQHVFDQNGTKIKIGSKLYRGHTYKTTYTPPENCILVTRVSYGRRLDNGRHGGSVTVPLPVTLPQNTYRYVWIRVGYYCPPSKTLIWVQDTWHRAY